MLFLVLCLLLILVSLSKAQAKHYLSAGCVWTVQLGILINFNCGVLVDELGGKSWGRLAPAVRPIHQPQQRYLSNDYRSTAEGVQKYEPCYAMLHASKEHKETLRHSSGTKVLGYYSQTAKIVAGCAVSGCLMDKYVIPKNRVTLLVCGFIFGVHFLATYFLRTPSTNRTVLIQK